MKESFHDDDENMVLPVGEEMENEQEELPEHCEKTWEESPIEDAKFPSNFHFMKGEAKQITDFDGEIVILPYFGPDYGYPLYPRCLRHADDKQAEQNYIEKAKNHEFVEMVGKDIKASRLEFFRVYPRDKRHLRPELDAIVNHILQGGYRRVLVVLVGQGGELGYNQCEAIEEEKGYYAQFCRLHRNIDIALLSPCEEDAPYIDVARRPALANLRLIRPTITVNRGMGADTFLNYLTVYILQRDYLHWSIPYQALGTDLPSEIHGIDDLEAIMSYYFTPEGKKKTFPLSRFKKQQYNKKGNLYSPLPSGKMFRFLAVLLNMDIEETKDFLDAFGCSFKTEDDWVDQTIFRAISRQGSQPVSPDYLNYQIWQKDQSKAFFEPKPGRFIDEPASEIKYYQHRLVEGVTAHGRLVDPNKEPVPSTAKDPCSSSVRSRGKVYFYGECQFPRPLTADEMIALGEMASKLEFPILACSEDHRGFGFYATSEGRRDLFRRQVAESKAIQSDFLFIRGDSFFTPKSRELIGMTLEPVHLLFWKKDVKDAFSPRVEEKLQSLIEEGMREIHAGVSDRLPQSVGEMFFFNKTQEIADAYKAKLQELFKEEGIDYEAYVMAMDGYLKKLKFQK